MMNFENEGQSQGLSHGVKNSEEFVQRKKDNKEEVHIGGEKRKKESALEIEKKVKSKPLFVLPLPFPQRFVKKKIDEEYAKFLEVLKQLHIDIPFVEMLENMPSYAKFMKEVFSKKKRFHKFETVALIEKCFFMMKQKILPKALDPGQFMVPCNVRDIFNGNALCNLGASVNLMPLSVCKQLGFGIAKPTTVILKLADQSLQYLVGVLEDVLVKLDDLIIPVDFIVVDFEGDKEAPLIFNCPTLAIAITIMDIYKGEIIMRECRVLVISSKPSFGIKE
ncbi:uncharacterized protein LOC129285996 [Prosopis cineraria]|uniref:uncharacterized protein LOC129285996 n=1 Tax=Prosopis cineraria TaxID=364024 RepID=UPI00240EB676|nr:uncharacterized protein LOC129285996 [Prosopis cineraria]